MSPCFTARRRIRGFWRHILKTERGVAEPNSGSSRFSTGNEQNSRGREPTAADLREGLSLDRKGEDDEQVIRADASGRDRRARHREGDAPLG
jgi:hypothetical protein